MAYKEMSSKITEMKRDNVWLSECPSQVLQMTARELAVKFTTSIPEYKKKNGVQSVRFPACVKILYKKSVVQIPKIGMIHCEYDRKFIGKIKMITLYKTLTDKYYIKVTVQSNIGHSIKPIEEESTLGISEGINTLYALSNGQRISNLGHIQNTEKRLVREQRKLSRCTGQSNRKKQQQVVYKVQEHLNNQRRDYIQKTTTKMIRTYNTIVVEKTDGLLQNILKYKCQWYGNNYVEVGRCKPCSDICSSCGTVSKTEGPTWLCSCGQQHNRNWNNAMNIRQLGLRSKPMVVNPKG